MSAAQDNYICHWFSDWLTGHQILLLTLEFERHDQSDGKKQYSGLREQPVRRLRAAFLAAQSQASVAESH